MRELFEICPKTRFLTFFWCFLRLEGGEFGQKRCKIGCSDVSGATWKNSLLKPWENDHFPKFSPIFPPVTPKNLVLPPKLLFFGKYKNRAVITQSFILIP